MQGQHLPSPPRRAEVARETAETVQERAKDHAGELAESAKEHGREAVSSAREQAGGGPSA